MTITSTSSQTRWIRPEDARLSDLLEVLGQHTDLADYPHATRVEQEVLVYDWATLRHTAADEVTRRDVQAELSRALADGPGIVVLAGAFDAEPLERTTAAFERMIAEQRASGTTVGDHFAKPGANDRIWNALEKLAVADPEAFVGYYANDAVALAAQAWLGPGYQVTSQLNVVNPGGAGQTVHRDYHLGFQSAETCAAYPAHVHALSQVLTLQGAVAHVDMPVESGPTLYLPHSQKFAHGYVAYQQPEFQEYFLAHHVQLPLSAGDAVFFNPALFHAAGTNHTTDVRRMANLLQISSAFGRAMETVDRARVVEATYPALLSARTAGMPPRAVANVVAATAEGYAFPTNLDRDQPIDGMSPRTQAERVAAALEAGMPPGELAQLLAAREADRSSH
ncbi:ectoine hydroxylase-related dioxygenase (phytanoyl-CoA dioxygenase family) [Humibacillus xanthopallidus]|uniref:Ectoine hydroxylase-related dioxygenase (Phytanoyl-CoA dioxygenase family) n=1 Tax=Humibacillus xanthopallidus TaxID=412689 RepID=A0A543PUS7_9MICO|nr:phytanoyl-CoA dioxygenase family protein [Humibacillus xanthopallidus]TQN47832.1 ectoine hydroxylase-related dioxygenase (phytanoyl-CoA dioxygenase family) [Humibacillus xanthopallidus]